MIDTTIEERFRVDERLVKQGFVELFKGVDLEQGQPVWIKRIAEPLNEELDFIGNWRAQLLSLQALDFPHLPRVLAFGRTPEDELYQVEPPPPGATLRRYASSYAPLGIARAVKLIATVARAVGDVHREGVAHGALTPENIYIDEDEEGRPQTFVTGWEMGEIVIAVREGGYSLPDRLARYLAPEQLTSPIPPATAASDVYTLALILYELLTGTFPTTATEGRRTTDPTPPSRYNPSVSRALEQVLLRALSRDPAARPPNGQAFASGLIEALQHPEPAAPPPPVTEPPARPSFSRPPWLPAVLLGALLLICALSALLFWGRDGAPVAQQVDLTATALMRAVPNFVGPPGVRYNEAVTQAWNQGFRVSITTYDNDNLDAPPGVITAQCPAPGTMPGQTEVDCPGFAETPPLTDTILVKVSSLPEPVVLIVVPDLYGQPEEVARTALEQHNLRLGTRRVARDELMPAGRIIEQNPRRGLAVQPGTPVDIIVSASLPTEQEGAAPLPQPTQPEMPSRGQTPESEPRVNASPTVNPSPTEAPDEQGDYLPPEEPTGIPSPTVGTSPTVETSPTTDGSPTPSPTPTPEEAADDGGETVLLEDDFEAGNELDWEIEESEGITATIESGVFRVEVTEPDRFWMSQPGRLFADFTYRAALTLVEAPEGQDRGGAGIVFRIGNDQQFYFFEINGDRSFRLRARDGDEWFTLQDWSTDSNIRPPGSENELMVQADGERLTLFINGNQIAVEDLPGEVRYSNGDIGVGVDAGTDPVIVEFDRMELTR